MALLYFSFFACQLLSPRKSSVSLCESNFISNHGLNVPPPCRSMSDLHHLFWSLHIWIPHSHLTVVDMKRELWSRLLPTTQPFEYSSRVCRLWSPYIFHKVFYFYSSKIDSFFFHYKRSVHHLLVYSHYILTDKSLYKNICIEPQKACLLSEPGAVHCRNLSIIKRVS